MTLKPEELHVESFETTATGDELSPSIVNPNDPTPATHCYWCPQETIGCA